MRVMSSATYSAQGGLAVVGLASRAPSRPELFSIVSDRFHPERAGASILHRMAGDLQFRAELQIRGTNAVAQQRGWTLRLESPGRYRTILVGDVHQQPRVRVGVLEFLDRALDRHFLLVVEHHRGVMRLDAQRGGHDHGQRNAGSDSTDHFAGSFGLSSNVKSLLLVLPSRVLKTSLFAFSFQFQ